MRKVMIAGTGSGCGKTTVTCALLAAYKNKGKKVASFKCGPDYIDPMFHEKAGLADCFNLDIFLMGDENVNNCLILHGKDADISIIEGVMGLYDGMGSGGFASANHVSEITNTPVVLVVNVKGKARSICAEIKGYLEYEKNNIRAIIVNNVRESMYNFYKEMIETNLNINVAGFMPPVEEAVIKSRHLGLIQADEIADIKSKIQLLADCAAKHVDMDLIWELAEDKSQAGGQFCEEISLQTLLTRKHFTNGFPSFSAKVYVANDEAFTFFYKDNHYLLESLGLTLHFFSPIHDKRLPDDADGLILWGGYPELYAKQLSQNTGMKESIRRSIQNKLPVYAECGGFIYLQQHLQTASGDCYEMTGAVEGFAKMGKRLNNFGYAELTANTGNYLCEKGKKINAHCFHYSYSDNEGDCFTAVKKSSGKQYKCIVASGNIFAGYPHTHFWGCLEMAVNFAAACEKYRKSGQGSV